MTMIDDNPGGGRGGDHNHAAPQPSRIRRRRPHGPARPRLVEIGDPVTAEAPATVSSDLMEGVDHHDDDHEHDMLPRRGGPSSTSGGTPGGTDATTGSKRRSWTRLVVGGGDNFDGDHSASGKGHGRRDHHGTAEHHNLREHRRDDDDGDELDGGSYSSLALAAAGAGGSSKRRKKTKTKTSVSIVSTRLVVGGGGGGDGDNNGNDSNPPGGAAEATSMATSSTSRALSRAQSLGESSADFGRWSSFGNGNNGSGGNGFGAGGGGFERGANDRAQRGDGDGDEVMDMEEVVEEEEACPEDNSGGGAPSSNFVAMGCWAGMGSPVSPSRIVSNGGEHGFAAPHPFHPPSSDHHHLTNNGYHHHLPGHDVGYQQQHQHQHHPHQQQRQNQHHQRNGGVTPPASAVPHDPLDEIIRMDVDVGPIPPLIVMDGANVAHSYASVRRNSNSLSSNATPPFVEIHNDGGTKKRHEPDARGIRVAAEYFLSSGCRVVAVVPAHWITARPRPGDEDRGNAMMKTPQLEALADLKSRGILCCAPPTDDDDAYILAIARRADARARSRSRGGDFNGLGGAYVLSCDLFRDAVAREHRHRKQHQQQHHRDGEVAAGTMGLRKWLNGGAQSPPGRISFTFCDTGAGSGRWGEEEEAELDFVPNPRHPLIAELEQKRLASVGNG